MQHKIFHDVKALSDSILGKQVVFTNGCFDILHAGHVTYLNAAKQEGDILIVGVNSDESVSRLKGPGRPINSIADRMVVLAALASVDYVISFSDNTPLKLIKAINPNILVKGGDYIVEDIVGYNHLKSYGGVVKTLAFIEGKSTTSIIENMTKHDHS